MNKNDAKLFAAESGSYYPSVDIAKFIFSILVITIHAKPFEAGFAASALSFAASIAVPFFYFCSGFFLFHSGVSALPVHRYFVKYCAVYLSASMLFLPFVNTVWFHGEAFSAKQLLWFVYNKIICGSFGQMWFLYALVLAVWPAYLILRLIKNPYVIFSFAAFLLFAGSLIYGYGVFGSAGSELSDSVFIGSQSALFCALPYLLSGGAFAFVLSKIKIRSLKSIWICITALTVSVLLYGAEGLLMKAVYPSGSRVLILSGIPSVCALFYLLSVHTGNVHSSNRLLRRISSCNYIIHYFVIFLFTYSFGFADTMPRFLFFIVTAATTSLLSLVIALAIMKTRRTPHKA